MFGETGWSEPLGVGLDFVEVPPAVGSDDARFGWLESRRVDVVLGDPYQEEALERRFVGLVTFEGPSGCKPPRLAIWQLATKPQQPVRTINDECADRRSNGQSHASIVCLLPPSRGRRHREGSIRSSEEIHSAKPS
jgi:hypothetical protein